MRKTLLLSFIIISTVLFFPSAHATFYYNDRQLNGTWISEQLLTINQSLFVGVDSIWFSHFTGATNKTAVDNSSYIETTLLFDEEPIPQNITVIDGLFYETHSFDTDPFMIRRIKTTQISVYSGAYSSPERFKCVVLHELGHNDELRKTMKVLTNKTRNEYYANHYAINNGCDRKYLYPKQGEI